MNFVADITAGETWGCCTWGQQVRRSMSETRSDDCMFNSCRGHKRKRKGLQCYKLKLIIWWFCVNKKKKTCESLWACSAVYANYHSLACYYCSHLILKTNMHFMWPRHWHTLKDNSMTTLIAGWAHTVKTLIYRVDELNLKLLLTHRFSFYPKQNKALEEKSTMPHTFYIMLFYNEVHFWSTHF